MGMTHFTQGYGTNFIQYKDAITADLRIYPMFLTSAFLFVQTMRVFFLGVRKSERHSDTREETNPVGVRQYTGIGNKLLERIRLHNGQTTFGFMLTRLIGTLLLLYLSATTKGESCSASQIVFGLCPQECITISIAYAAFLAIVSFCPHLGWMSPVRFHVAVLLSILGVYIYRDIWPLATNDGVEPADIAEGVTIWIKILLLALTAGIIPLFIPHAYTPADPKTIPTPEQTASWFSAVTYSYIDPLIRLANRVPHLRHDELPPLSDHDAAKFLTSWASRYIDPFTGAPRRHLFFGLLYHFRREYLIVAANVVATAISSFLAPIGINKTLKYLETQHEDETPLIKPWVWIMFMLAGPILNSAVEHWYLFKQYIIRVRTQAILTQLFFEQSLRMRMKGDASGGEGADTDASSVSDKSSSDAENLNGKINNLITSDLENIAQGCDFLSLLLYAPLHIILSIIFLWKVLGWSALVGLSTLIALGFIPGYFSKLAQDAQVIKMKLTDARVQSITEAVGVLRMIKLFGWEEKMAKSLEIKREEELTWLWKMKKLKLGTEINSVFIPAFSMVATYASYTILMKEGLTASKIFSSMAVFSILRQQIFKISGEISLLIEGKVSLDRATFFMQDTELLDQYTAKKSQQTSVFPSVVQWNNGEYHDDHRGDEIGFKKASFSWSVEDGGGGSLTPLGQSFKLRIDGELIFKKKCVNLITGPTGSGKTAMLMALLGEMHFIPTHVDSWYNLPRQGGVAYAAQESWVQNTSIRENIVFGSPFDEQRYLKVIRQCALERDLELFDAGDMTEVGERGLTLSGGQKARVTLARAIYSSADILLLDDIFAALDIHTATWIVDQCFRGDLVEGRTILLVTHNLALAAPIASNVLSLSLDGSFKTHDTKYAQVEFSQINRMPESNVDNQVNVTVGGAKENTTLAQSSRDGKLILPEEVVHGHITWKSMNLIISNLGGRFPLVFTAINLGGMVLAQSLVILETWFVGVWGSQYETRPPSEVDISYYLLVFIGIIMFRVVIFSAYVFNYNYRTIKASRAIHAALVDSVFGSTLRWLDGTPTGRIIARCTQDIRSVDGPLPELLFWSADQGLGMFTTLGSVLLFTPMFIFPGIVVGMIAAYIGHMYLRAQLSLKREMSNARSPLLAHFTATLHGLVSIRAYDAQKAFTEESFKRIDHYSRIARTSWNVNRWVSFRIDALGPIFTSALAFYLVYGKSGIGAANSGFSLNMALNFCLYIFSFISIFSELEVESNSLERIQGYLDIEHEPKPTASGEPPAAWPTSGDIRVENLSARYSESGPKVLSNLSFHIKSGERIGVVGRTGSGKSSLTLALLRSIITEGTVYYDNIPTKTLNLDALRSNITIIPQVPELLSGTLRQNLDPFDQNGDASLNDALSHAGFHALQEEAGEARLTLDSRMSGGGNNLSIGQRQIIALARAILRRSKLLILDEATSAIDYKTDAIIQSTLRNKLDRDVTVITIAHRLQTIMDADKIMVLDGGKIVEFDEPRLLLQKQGGTFRALVEGSGDQATI